MLHPLITVSQLASLFESGEPSLRVFDCRYSLMDSQYGAKAYATSHLPGAAFIDVNRDLSTPHIAGKTGRHPLPAREDWITRVCNLGITPDTLVVLYDDGGGASSSRMWWMLQWIGHDKVAVLDGGWQAWLAAGLPVTQAPVTAAAKVADHYSALAPRVQLVLGDQVDGSRQLLIDARDQKRFDGEVEPIDPVAGHIPQAVCSPHGANLQADGRFQPPQQLREKFTMAINSSKPVVCYCGSGITACHNILAMAAAGLKLPALYAGSWSEWITDPQHPIAKAPAAGQQTGQISAPLVLALGLAALVLVVALYFGLRDAPVTDDVTSGTIERAVETVPVPIESDATEAATTAFDGRQMPERSSTLGAGTVEETPPPPADQERVVISGKLLEELEKEAEAQPPEQELGQPQ